MSKSTSKNYRKFIASAAAMAVVAPMVAPVASLAAANFPDVEGQYVNAVEYLASKGIQGKLDGTFGTHDNITRQDAAVFVAKALGLDTEKAPNAGFTDVAPRAVGAANALKAEGITAGKSATTFGGGDLITRGELAKWIAAAFDLEAGNANNPFSDVEGHYVDAVKALVENEVTSGKTATKFGTHDNATRGQFAVFVYKAAQVDVDTVVKDVKAVNAKQVELTGTGLAKLDSKDISIEGNTVEDVKFDAVTGKAVVTFATPFTSGVEQTLVSKNAEGVEKEFTFTYTLEVSSVEATTTRVDKNTDKQFLGFTINGGDSVSVKYLLDAGYKVQFQATNNSVLDNAATGELKKAALSADFSYKVVVSKDDVTVESDLIKVEVLDFASYISTISEVTIAQGNVSVTSGKVPVQNGTVTVKATKATALNGATINDPTVTYKSSNPSVATVNATTGAVTPIKAGTVTITVEANNATYSVPLTVVSGAREATTVTATTTSVKLLEGQTKNVDFTAVDQYGDEFEGTLNVVSRDAAIADGSAETLTFANGKGIGTVKAIDKGNTVIDLKRGTTTLKSVNIAVSDDAKVASRKIETVSPSADLALDVVKGSDDKEVTLVWNQYNEGGFLIGPETALKSTYSVSSSDATVATATLELDKSDNPTGNIIVKGLKKGTADVVIKEGTVTRATAKITVTDSTPTITAVDFEEVETVTTESALTAPVLTTEGITLSSTDFTAEIAKSGVIYADVDGTNGYNATNDITLGKLTVKYSGTQADVTGLGVNAGSVVATKFAPGAEGTIVTVVTLEGATEAFATSTINVKVPK